MDGVEVALQRVRHPARLFGFGVAMAVVLVGAFVAGLFVKAPTDDALEAAKTVVPVVVTVENRVVDDGFTIPASVTAGKTLDVTITEASIPAPASAGRQESSATGASDERQQAGDRVLVTATAITPGDTIGYGRLLGEVSGRPVFSLPSSVPLYRDLLPAAEGNDVSALQTTLIDLGYYGVRKTGVLDAGTLDAARRLYAKAGYSLPFVAAGVPGIAWREFAGLPTPDTKVVSAAPVGTTLSSDIALLRLQISPAVLTARITAVLKDDLLAGTPVGVSVNGADPAKSSVLAVGAFTTDEESGASGYPITVGLPSDAAIAGDSTIALTPLEKPAAGPAIPVVALRQGTEGVSVTVEAEKAAVDAAKATAAHNLVRVEVLTQQNGWASIKPNPKLPVGTKLVVEP
ncbi:peptidoglycan-binding domain-containing protein [Frondihabitans sucicola]|uniref:peptidoglycan-binding domain-containing protein n=1 Tax=Frondihabitans sucicola TaxID=1268041 RepID=UPI0025747B70|nr:peptidoglycan-binding domain-containing protein [Frondihabitans sucicola]